MNLRFLLLIAMMGLAHNVCAQQAGDLLPNLPTGEITVQVVNENGAPLSGAKVSLAFLEPKPKWGSARENTVRGITNKDGKFTGSGPCPLEIGGKVELAGYDLTFLPKFHYADAQDGKCIPWNPTVKVVLKKTVN